MNTLKARTNEESVVYPDNSPALLETLKSPMIGARGQLYGVVGISRDITERHKLHEHIRTSENIYRNVLKTALDGFWIVSMDGVIQDANRAYSVMSGYTHEELVGMPIFELEVFENENAVKAHIALIKQAISHRFETKHRRKDGSIFDVEINVTYWPDEGGKIFVFIKDVTERHLAETLLQESEARFRNIFEQTPTMAVQGYDREHKAVFWNKASETLFGYTSEQALGETIENLIVPEHKRELTTRHIDMWFMDKQVDAPSEMVLQRADGSAAQVFSSHVLFESSSGQTELYCIHMDLTALKQAEDQIVTLSQAIEQSPVSVILTDTRGMIEYVNAEFEKVTGYSRDEVIGKPTSMLKSGQTASGKYKELWKALTRGKPWEGEFQNSKKDGTVFWESAHIAPLTNSLGQVTHFLAVKQDITHHKIQEEKILHQAHFDSLTDLPNRFLSLDRLEQMIREAKRAKGQVAVFFLDLDDFKKVNDTLGHQVGDELLTEAAKRLRDAVREADIVGRLGGDEFIVMMSLEMGSGAIMHVASNLLEAFRAPFSLNGRELVSTVSIGVAVYPNDGLSPAELLRQADAAMYYSKSEGRNTFNFYTESMNKDVARRLLIEEQLRGALARNELTVHYQAVVRLQDRKLIGAEALLRWKNELVGNITPDEFIPIAEQTGLIVNIGRYVLEQAISQAAEWRQRYTPEFTIAINLSPRQFRDAQLLPCIVELLSATQTKPSQLELEITEGVLMSGHAEVDKMLSSIHELGVTISMDDFGTGYSSLSYLRSYPFNVLKVDKSFVSDISVDTADLELVSAAVSMAHGLGLEVIAEGVETEQQYQLLLDLGCNFAQGYLFGKPLDKLAFEARLQEGLIM
jgi:diguanylate cyclase (GGDEF)-like protein/PAS domain S-box-containing protein